MNVLTHWGWVTHICVIKLTIIVSDNGLSPRRRQAIIWTDAGILLIQPSGTNFSEILIEIDVFSYKKMHLKMSSAKCQPSCLGLNVCTVSTTKPGMPGVHGSASNHALQYSSSKANELMTLHYLSYVYIICLLSMGRDSSFGLNIKRLSYQYRNSHDKENALS